MSPINNTNQTTLTLNDILVVLGTKSVSLNDLYENKQDNINVNDVDMNIIFNEVMRYSNSKSITNNENTNNRNRKISNTITNTGEILCEMDEKNSENELEGSDETDDDLELECMYNNNNNITPGNNNNNDALAIDENVNRFTMIHQNCLVDIHYSIHIYSLWLKLWNGSTDVKNRKYKRSEGII